ncbi:MAG: hypothetical protein K0U79_09595 [Gammaproteobacteria bacterium]|nr:hypothetical protein [Gammaproteobacteria bacterium]
MPWRAAAARRAGDAEIGGWARRQPLLQGIRNLLDLLSVHGMTLACCGHA